MRPIFCGNLDYDVRQSEVERLFKRYGKIDRVDMKSGFCFVYMEDERDAEYAIRRLDRIEFGRKGRRLRVEWTKQERDTRRGGSAGGGGRKSAANSKPSKTLFVINFDPIHTRSRDIERHFEPYGKIVNVRIRRNFAFVQYESEDDAARALDATNMSKLMDRVITVEFAIRDDDDRRNGFSPDRRGRDGSADRGYDRRRSPSPYRRERGSPDYGYRRERESPDYGQGGNGKSKSDAKDSPNYGRDRDVSPANGKYNSRSPPRRGRSRSPVARERSRSPRASLHQRSRDRSPPPRGRSHSPMQERSPLERGERSPLERRERSPLERGERSPLERGERSPLEGGERSPLEGGERSPLERGERSPSPVARERSRSRS